jgi:Tol biopolymer transport system component
VINADGSHTTDLVDCDNPDTKTNGAWQVSWSPDGTSIVFDADGINIVDVVLNDDGDPVVQNERTIVGTGEEYDPAWSSDGTTIAYITSSWGRATDIRVIPVAGGTPTVVCDSLLSPGGCGRFPAWSPDGTRIAFTGDGLLRVLTLATGEIDILIPPGEFESTSWRPAWSPTGDRIAFTGAVPGTDHVPQSVYVYELATGTYSLLFENGRMPTWSPDGAELAIVNRNRKNYGLIVIDPETGALQRHLTKNVWMSPDWRRCESGPGCGPGN